MVKPLKETFTKNGYDYKLVERCDKWAIFEQSFEGVVCASEVIKVLKSMPTCFHSEPFERYPSSEQWGKNGWTYLTFEKAEKKYNELLLSNGRRDSKKKKEKNN